MPAPSSAITQFFFEAETFFRFRDRAVKAGITRRSSPASCRSRTGPAPSASPPAAARRVPAWLDEAFTAAIRDGREDLLATAICTELCSELLEGGVEDLHFYTLNKPQLTRDVVHALGIARPRRWKRSPSAASVVPLPSPQVPLPRGEREAPEWPAPGPSAIGRRGVALSKRRADILSLPDRSPPAQAPTAGNWRSGCRSGVFSLDRSV